MNNYKDKYDLYLSKINNRLNELLIKSTYEDDIVCDAMRYSVENGGKRIRPVLVLEACSICGGEIDDAVDIACALEMIHTYSLIHDDLPCMDNDDMRRGKPSCHIKYGEEYALLAGDGLLTYAFEVITGSNIGSDKIVKAVRCLANNSGFNGMIGGQVVDLRSEGKQISYERLKTMHSLKTGALIRCAAELGCICAGADEEKTAQLVSYADRLGLAFQIVDDILDVIGDEKELGKPVGSDSVSEKTTYVTLFGLDAADTMAKEITAEAKKAINGFINNDFLMTLADKLTTRKS
ncbi:MAG: polyprenyl synthetase family protein [Ruminococcaceae bacterium]|nr:polyprenyl synthetase family protein [Oscillospiraceae bacterium]